MVQTSICRNHTILLMLKAWFPVAFFAFPVATQSVHGTVFFFFCDAIGVRRKSRCAKEKTSKIPRNSSARRRPDANFPNDKRISPYINHQVKPIGSMYDTYANIEGILMVNVTIYGSTMDPMGNK